MTQTVKFQNAHRAFKLSFLALAATLVACGGGGGGGGSGGGSTGPVGSVTPGPIVVTPPAPIRDPDIVTSVPVATYLASSPEARIFEVLNAERARCGFGLLAQNTALDKASTAHANYQLANDFRSYVGHTETVGKPGFTGVTVADRVRVAGYAGVASEGTVPAGGPRKGDTAQEVGEFALRRLLALPYHQQDLMRGYREIGIAFPFTPSSDPFLAPGTGMFVHNPGLAPGKALQASSTLRTYPCNGSKDTHAEAMAELPRPFPNEDPNISTWGQPIVEMGASDLKITSATVTGPVGTIPIKAIYGNGSGATEAPHKYFVGSLAVVIPTTLKTNSTYAVSIIGTNNGAVFNQEFSFSTGQFTTHGRYRTGQF